MLDLIESAHIHATASSLLIEQKITLARKFHFFSPPMSSQPISHTRSRHCFFSRTLDLAAEMRYITHISLASRVLKARMSCFLLAGDSPSTSLAFATPKYEHRRQITGFINNHRPVPSMTSSTPPQRSSVIEPAVPSPPAPLPTSTHRANLHNFPAMVDTNTMDRHSPARM